MEVISRAAALETGRKTYYTGKPCIKGHVAERFTKWRICFECHRQSGARTYAKRIKTDPAFKQRHRSAANDWKKANREKNNETVRAWRKANPEKVRQKNKRWREKYPEKERENHRRQRERNPERIAAKLKEWKERNPERHKELRKAVKITRRAREAGNGGRVTRADIEALHFKQNGCCAVCPTSYRLEVDHILPICLGGSSDPSNLQLLCRRCNRAKAGKHPDQWREELRRRAPLCSKVGH